IQSKVSRQEELWEMLDTILIRRKKQDAAVKNSINVPEPIHHRHHLAMSQDEKALYESKLQQFQDWYQLELLKKEEAEKRGDKYRIQTIKICSWMDVLRKVASCPWSFDEFTSTELPAKVSYLKNKPDH
ncbi:SNF2/RAD54 family helicase, partial [Flavobacterium sp. IR1]